jgi:hypothetical protein
MFARRIADFNALSDDRRATLIITFGFTLSLALLVLLSLVIRPFLTVSHCEGDYGTMATIPIVVFSLSAFIAWLGMFISRKTELGKVLAYTSMTMYPISIGAIELFVVVLMQCGAL